MMPLFIVLKAMGVGSDKNIIDLINPYLSDEENKNF